MKKVVTLIAMLGIIITGCSVNDKDNYDKPEVTDNNVKEEISLKEIEKKENPKDISDFEVIGEEYYYDIDDDGEEDKIGLYTSAQKEGGYFMWEDSHEWVLRVENKDGIYDLYDNHIHGKAYMGVYDYYNDGQVSKVITLNVLESASNEIREYTFKNSKCYENIAYTTTKNANEGISEMYSTIPDYE